MSTPSPQEIQVLDTNIASAIKTLARNLGESVTAGRRTCVHCIHFREQTEGCVLAGEQRPPARVIAFGCPAFCPDEIPF